MLSNTECVRKLKVRLRSSRKKSRGRMTFMLRKTTINRATMNNKMLIKSMRKKMHIP